ncbi:MAG: S-adenosylmethionine:tRNA ribosyltransferase-isomerase [Anaerolineae bacterium]|nr:S-adenosylmethionine:tRNA ribosyltransferase-isomerase [Anaerolineae bacterium]
MATAAETALKTLEQSLDFALPDDLHATMPAEVRGLRRDEVRLMASHYHSNKVAHAQFKALTDFLDPGDVLVINTSGTLNAALSAQRADGTPLELHLSTRLPDGHWLVEARQPGEKGTKPFPGLREGEILRLPTLGRAVIRKPYQRYRTVNLPPRLWHATLILPEPVDAYLERHGFPIRYGYVREFYPIAYYQTVFATEPGSAEMPSAGRPFTHRLVTRLAAKGVQFAPLLLHTGVSSQENREPPYPEYYRVSRATAHIVNAARHDGRRVVAVGTTAIRALETVTDGRGRVRAGEGWTELVVTPERGIFAVDGLITGFHEPKSSHLAMLEALAGRPHLEMTYAEALRERYLWHEFGDVHLLLPG